ncbi:MAG: hypothetical protein IC227_09720 [Enterococcus lacertideformus]|uniref:Uncharacterized protein n=1 Tax=Enterococcus lacertideformus TaxID=2771493 RepID=A0A931F940_9ENTE|nr:hypothetical protein [Enterococcus lacertideformus]
MPLNTEITNKIKKIAIKNTVNQSFFLCPQSAQRVILIDFIFLHATMDIEKEAGTEAFNSKK